MTPTFAALDDLQRRFPVMVTQAVVWGDMDAYQHVNNVVYFRYFESARIELFRRLDWMAVKETTGVGPIIASTQARFRRALAFPDTIAIGARVLSLEADRFTLEHRIVSHAQQDWVTEGQALIVSYDYASHAKAPIPDAVRAKLLALGTV